MAGVWTAGLTVFARSYDLVGTDMAGQMRGRYDRCKGPEWRNQLENVELRKYLILGGRAELPSDHGRRHLAAYMDVRVSKADSQRDMVGERRSMTSNPWRAENSFTRGP